MRQVVSARAAGIAVLAIFAALIVFHLLVLFRLLPSGIVWGGRAGRAPSNLLVLELVSLVFTLIFAAIVAAKIGLIGVGRFGRAVNVLLWIVFAYLVLNSLGNLASGSRVEKLVFTPATIVAALLVLRLAIER